MPLRGSDDLRRELARIDGRGYKAYQDLRGEYDLGQWRVEIAHVQPDPYAPPSRIHARIDLRAAGLAPFLAGPSERRLGLEDHLGRRIAAELHRSGARAMRVDAFGQEILRRTVVQVRPPALEARLFVELPAAGRSILGRQAATILLDELPAVLARAIEGASDERAELERHQDTAEDHAALARLLDERGWVAFVADGAVLPRRSGQDDRPLEPGAETAVVPFAAPSELAAEVRLPHAGLVRGLPIRAGVTLLVGGGFHGKSTLLEALARGIYPHLPGDGRERVACDPRAVKIRAEDGRAVTATDISPFIGDLPYGRSTKSFSTQNASGSTSQAANIVEALEAGARALLIDEDTSATNFMIRDEPMRRLLRPGQEPIIPFLDRVRNLHRDRGVSTVLVIGGSGEYFRVADQVILMERYRPSDATAAARAALAASAASLPADRRPEELPFPPAGPARRLSLGRYRSEGGARGPRIQAQGARRILIEREEVDLSACEQIISASQARTLAEILARLIEASPRDPLWAGLQMDPAPGEVVAALGTAGEDLLDRASRHARGDLAEVRPIELVAMLNRLRQLHVASGQG